MPVKRKPEHAHDNSVENRRQTRHSTSLNSNIAISTQRKRHRASSPDTEIENSPSLQTPRSRRIRDRRTNKLSDYSSQAKVLEESELSEVNLIIDTPRRSRRRVILDAVEIPTTVKANAIRNTCKDVFRESNTEDEQASIEQLPSKMISTPTRNVEKVSKLKRKKLALEGEVELPNPLPVYLHGCLERQKRAILNVLNNPCFDDLHLDDRTEDTSGANANEVALQQLNDLLCGSIERGEGNSCLVIGPAGSGKSMLFEKALKNHREEQQPIIIRLNGHIQHTDRLAIREIARQVVEQAGSKVFQSIDINGEDHPFDDSEGGAVIDSLPPPSHLPSLIASLPSLPRPVVVLLDAFNIFTEQPRQALLYCLLDTVQSCRAGSSSQRGLAVVGLTSRIDVVNFLEKRVKSRFSHRILRTANLSRPEEWLTLLQKCLSAEISISNENDTSSWHRLWRHSVKRFLEDRTTNDSLKYMFGITRDVRRLFKTMASMVVRLTTCSPYLTSQGLQECLESHVRRPQKSLLMRLSYPSLSLCIAAQHIRTAGHDSFTFEMLFDLFVTQVRTSSAAPVMLGGGSIGMVNIGRRVLLAAFEELIHMKIFLQAGPSTTSLSREFIKHRCTVERDDIKDTVDRVGQTNLKKWFNKAQ